MRNDVDTANGRLMALLARDEPAADERKHAHLSRGLRQAIAQGVFQVGDKLPTETELVSWTLYSLGTVQRAIRSLVEEGLVERKPKLGTFVVERRMIDRPWHFRFLDSDRKTLLPVYPTVVGRSMVRQRGPWNDFLAGPLLCIERLVNVNDEFVAFSRFFVDPARFPMFERVPQEELDGENFRILLNRYIAEPIQRIHHRIALHKVDSRIAGLIGIPAAQDCTIVDIAAATARGDHVYYQELTVPPSQRRLELIDPSMPRAAASGGVGSQAASALAQTRAVV